MVTNYHVGKVASGVNIVPIDSSLALASKGAPSGTDTGRNHLYALTTHQESKASPDVILVC